jgi:hypothetical protein
MGRHEVVKTLSYTRANLLPKRRDLPCNGEEIYSGKEQMRKKLTQKEERQKQLQARAFTDSGHSSAEKPQLLLHVPKEKKQQ